MYRAILSSIGLVVFCFGIALGSGQPAIPNVSNNTMSGGNHWLVGQVQMGYYGGVGILASATAQNFAENFPFAVRLGLGYSRVKSGDEWAARRVFINNNTNGTARSNAHVWDARLDILYPIKLLNLNRTTFFVGPRHSDFNAYFEYIGGAETFNVISHQWGLGSGIESAYSVSPRVDLVFSVSADYYFRNTLSGHDTYYRPNGDDTHPIANYTYKDADAAINQPDVMTRIMVGWAYHF
jgi:hypothetical protein